MKIIYQNQSNILSHLGKLLENRTKDTSQVIDKKVKNIINTVKLKGDRALLRYTKKYDCINIEKSQLLLSNQIRKKLKYQINQEVLKSFKLAIRNISKFHKKQIPQNYQIKEKGVVTGLIWKPIESVGLYVPGGLASYQSTLLMNVIPAQVAGVKRIVVATPNYKDNFNPYVIALLDILGIKEVYQIGGAQAIAALAYGTETIRPVNKIFGPGNAYVTSAKKQVFGKVGIDLIAGPSEIVVVADKNNNPKWVAGDLIAQAEHDEKSQCILITDDETFAKKVKENIKLLSLNLKKKNIIHKSFNSNGAIIILKDLLKAAELIDIIAPEHLHLHNKSANKIFKKVKNAGAIFIGEYAAEAFGDYIVGTNHVLPTSGSAKYSSGLGVIDFMKRTSYVSLNQESFNKLSNHVANMALSENLDGHKLSVTIRQKDKK